MNQRPTSLPFLLTALLLTAPAGAVDDPAVTGQVTFVTTAMHVVTDRGRPLAFFGNTGNLREGDLVIERYHPIVEDGRTVLLSQDLRVIGHDEPPPPLDMTLEELLARKLYRTRVRMRVQIENFVRDEDFNDILMTVRSGTAVLKTVYLSHGRVLGRDLDRLIGTTISLTGIYFDHLPSSRPFRGPLFLPTDFGFLTLPASASADSFDAPALTPPEASSPESIASIGLRTLTGTVFAHWGDALVLKSDLPLRYPYHSVAPASGIALPPVGESVEVIGQPETDCYRINFSSARFRPCKAAPARAQRNEPARKGLGIWRGRRNGHLVYNDEALGRAVRLRGTLLSFHDASPGAARFTLLVDDTPTDVDASHCPEVLGGLRPGSVLDVTGICLFEIGNWRPGEPHPQIRGHELVLRDAADLAVVSLPPWWTYSRLWWMIAGLGTLLVGALVWNRILDKIVLRRTRELLRVQTAQVASELRIGERTRLAVELHDTLSQNLAGVACQVASAKAALGRDPQTAGERLTVVERMLKASRTDLRMVLSDLRSEALETSDFATAIRQVLEPLATGIEVQVRVAIPRTLLHDSTAHAILCIVRELAGNAIRHGGASVIRIAGAVETSRIDLSVRENGCGFDPSACPGPAEGHFGLDGIRNRVARLGGRFELDAAPGKGSRAVIRIPLRIPTAK